MDNTKFFKIVILVLLLINIATLTFVWTTSQRPPSFQPRPPDVGEFLTQKLQLTEAQQKQFEALKQVHHEKVETLREKNKKLHNDFFDLLKQPNIDTTTINMAADAIMINQKAIEMATFYHFEDVRSICTPNQQKMFDEVIKEALRMMSPPPPGPPHGGPPPH